MRSHLQVTVRAVLKVDVKFLSRIALLMTTTKKARGVVTASLVYGL